MKQTLVLVLKHQKVSKYYGQDCSLANLNSRPKFEFTLKFLLIKLLGKGIQEIILRNAK